MRYMPIYPECIILSEPESFFKNEYSVQICPGNQSLQEIESEQQTLEMGIYLWAAAFRHHIYAAAVYENF